jgi:hypothetical protein
MSNSTAEAPLPVAIPSPSYPLPTSDVPEVLQKAIDNEAEQFLNPWVATIPFEVVEPYSNHNVPQMVPNIMDYSLNMYNNQIIRFSTAFTPDERGLHQLKEALLSASVQHAGAIISTRSSAITNRKGSSCCLFLCCKHGFIYRGEKLDQESNEIRDDIKYRNSGIINDKKHNAREDGQKGPRRSNTQRALTKTERCPFSLSIYCDNISYYLKGGVGCPFHQFHCRLDPTNELRLPSRMVKLEERELLKTIGAAHARAGVLRNVYFLRSGVVLTQSQVAGIASICGTSGRPRKRKKKKNKSSSSSSDDNEGGESPTDKMLQYFKDNEADYICLYHHATSQELRENRRGASTQHPDHSVLSRNPMPTCTAETNVQQGITPSSFGVMNDVHLCQSGEAGTHVSAPEESDLKYLEAIDKYAKENRAQLRVADSNDLMIACAWVLPQERRQFMLFPFVLHVDTTADSNKEKRPLLTVSGRDSTGKMFTVLRALVPNERTWIFRWIFQTVFPTLLGVSNLSLVKVIVSDGDSQETSQLDSAIKKFLPDAFRIRCSWHIISKGWEAHCPNFKTVAQSMQVEFEAIKKTIHTWMYTWAWPGNCETEEEFLVSKALFMKYLNSQHVLDVLGEANVTKIKDFHRNHVAPLEDFLCYYKRRDVLSLFTSSNTAQEGTFKGIKYSAAPVLPQFQINTTASTLTMNGNIKVKNTMIENARQESSKKLWSKLPTANSVTTLAESIIKSQWTQRNEYICHRSGRLEWLLTRVNEVDDVLEDEADAADQDGAKGKRKGIIPRFLRVRKVTLDPEGNFLRCTCNHFENSGIPCRHIMKVLCDVDPNYKGVTHRDVAVFWWKRYYFFGMSLELSMLKGHSRLPSPFLRIL